MDASRALAWQLPADTVEWYQGTQANRDDAMRSRGVASSGAEQYEFEESLQFTAAGVRAHVHVTRGVELPPHEFRPISAASQK